MTSQGYLGFKKSPATLAVLCIEPAYVGLAISTVCHADCHDRQAQTQRNYV